MDTIIPPCHSVSLKRQEDMDNCDPCNCNAFTALGEMQYKTSRSEKRLQQNVHSTLTLQR